jgi:MYXO-CTERM domain-containing protein
LLEESLPGLHPYPRTAAALAGLLMALAWPSAARAAAPIIECNEMTVGQPCDTDNTRCTQEKCARVGASVECQPIGNAPDDSVCESDDKPCTIDECEAGVCRHNQLPVGTVCFDGLFCTDGEKCDAAGECTGGMDTCDDHDVCTADMCDEGANTCSHSGRKTCADDGKPCTDDSCDPLFECNYAPLPSTTACDDDRFCTIGDHCDGEGECTGSLNCIDSNGCTVDACDEDADQCKHDPDLDAPCDDANTCTENDKCTDQAECLGTALPDDTTCSEGGGCRKDGVCTGGVCGGTSAADDGTPCDDGNACNEGETCTGGVCGGGAPKICAGDGTNACSIAGCDPTQGCVSETIPGCDAGPGPTPDAGPTPDGGLAPDAGIGGADGGGVPQILGDLGGGGCGCEVGGKDSPGSGAALVLLVAALLLLRRGRSLLVLLVLFGAGRAHAEGFDAQLFKPTTSTTGFISQDGPDVLPSGFLHVRLTFDVATDLLVLRDPDTGEPVIVRDPMTGEVIADGKVLSNRTGVTLGASYGIADRFELSAALPVAMSQSGNLMLVNREGELAGTALGDLRLGGKVRLLDAGPFRLGAALNVVVPTGDDEAFAGAGTVVVTPRVIAGVRLGRLALAANGGYALRQPGGAGNLEVDDELVFGAGARFDLQPRRLALLGESYARVGVQGMGVERELPAEALFALRWQVSGPWAIDAGGGFGITRGYGTPAARAFLSFAYAPLPALRVVAPTEEVVIEKAPPPAPEGPRDTDKDGITDDKDKCPSEPEDVDGVQDDDGCPDPDQDADGILDAVDKCPTEPEVVNGVDDQDGCPDEGLFELKEDRIVLEERVLFDTDRARVRSAGKRVLKAVVVLWNQHPEYEKMVVEGHTDERGSDEHNQKLGLLRAERVKKALIEQGFPADKIEIVSYGRSRPVDTSGSEQAWAKNRRTEFVIVKKTKVPAAPAAPAAPPAPTP